MKKTLKKTSWLTVITTLCLVAVTLFATVGCDKNENNILLPCHCIMDTLKGEWCWMKTYTPKHGIIDNEFKSILKVLGQNENSSINYEVFVEDTLYYRSSFKYQYDQYNNRINNANIKLPHWIPSLLINENWIIYFRDMQTGVPNKNTLCFWDGSDDGYFYYYQKIRKE